LSYIDYIEFLKRDEKIKINPKNCFVFKDLLSRTEFAVDLDKANDLSIKAINYIESSNDNLGDKVDRIYSLLNNKEDKNLNSLDYSKDENNLILLGRLPYLVLDDNRNILFKKTKKINCMIGDYTSIRTGTMYSIYYNKLKNDKIAEFRLNGILNGIDCYIKDKSKAENFKISLKLKNNEFENYVKCVDDLMLGKELKNIGDVDFVRGAQVKIKGYYLETDKIKSIRGASIILDEINREKLIKEIKKDYIEECIIYNGGGNFQGVFPKNTGKRISNLYEQIHEKKTVTAQSIAEYITVSMKDIVWNYKKATERLIEKFTRRQMSKVNWNTGFNEPSDNLIILNNKNKLCDYCNFRFATKIEKHKDSASIEYFCNSCHKKFEAGGKSGKSSFADKYIEYLIETKNANIEIVKDKKVFKYYDSKSNYKEIKYPGMFEDIAKLDSNGYLGVIYGDGNNMGKIVQNVESLGEMRYFSTEMDKGVYNAVYEAIYKIYEKYCNADKNKLSLVYFEIIAIGGDDIFIIVPADISFELAMAIGEKFDRKFENKTTTNDSENMTMSLGLCISHSNTSIKYLNEKVLELMKNAKKKAKVTKQGTFSYKIIDNDCQLVNNDYYLNYNFNYYVNSMKPYTWNEANLILDKLKELKEYDSVYNTKSFIGKMKHMLFNMSINESKLYYLYTLSRLSSKECKKYKDAQMFINNILKDLNIDEKSIGKIDSNEDSCEIHSHWIDFEELWNFVRL
jgi:hypothetical protein